MNILDFDTQQTIKPISLNNMDRYNQILREVGEFELSNLLGNTFYQEILANYNPDVNDKWKDLVEGSIYVDDCGMNAKNYGLQYVLAFFVYAQYLQESFVHDTFTGMVQKVRTDSEPISLGTMKNLQTYNKSIANNYFDSVKGFICTTNQFDNYYQGKTKKVNKGFDFVGIKRTRK